MTIQCLLYNGKVQVVGTIPERRLVSVGISTFSITDWYKRLVQCLLMQSQGPVQEAGTVPLNHRPEKEVGTVPGQSQTGTRGWYSTCSITDWYKRLVQCLLNHRDRYKKLVQYR